jgi:protein-tyrosine phosphatase
MSNVCRSPTAEAVLRQLVEQNGLTDRIEVCSAGTHGFRVGEACDANSQRVARAKGYDLSQIRARRIGWQDLDYFDLILAMDRNNLYNLRRMATEEQLMRIRLIMDYARFTEDEVLLPHARRALRAGPGDDRGCRERLDRRNQSPNRACHQKHLRHRARDTAKMSIEISREASAAAITSIQRYFDENRDEAIGNRGGALLGFFLKEIAPIVYNQAVADVQTRLQARITELDFEVLEPEFQYWQGSSRKRK